ncbi:hypothetical protein G3I20_33485 [Streptomyces sp. SID8111]|uniref:alpha/beta hydrolase n=1 Tax=Streptomyces sp. SID8111 TaxID=2706100 RepID=UPI0013C0B68B|nr:alpha/beta hydrolase [Streptomyces sp. SID8111]NEC31386.1 hypothetical protein [Streptomyces sp. SID8111]
MSRPLLPWIGIVRGGSPVPPSHHGIRRTPRWPSPASVAVPPVTHRPTTERSDVRTHIRQAGPCGNPVHDPATSYQGAQDMTRRPADARLLTLRGYGHTALLNPSTCVNR